jgi:ribosomal protein L24E
MNIFYLSRDPVEAAKLQCDRHVVKMILETAQLLSTAHVELDGRQVAYKATHKNHPSAVWVRSNPRHYRWTHQHLMALGREYERRYGKVHRTIREHGKALETLPVALDPLFTGSEPPFVHPPQCMPDDCKRDDAVLGYQVYYNHKADDWDARGIPMRWYGREAV